MQDYSINRYANSVIAGKPEKFDAIEVHGVRSYQTGADSFSYEVDDKNPESYSVYLHLKEGGVDCVGDFTRKDDALDYAGELCEDHDWPIHSVHTYDD